MPETISVVPHAAADACLDGSKPLEYKYMLMPMYLVSCHGVIHLVRSTAAVSSHMSRRMQRGKLTYSIKTINVITKMFYAG
jgi:hypothetical protein